MIRGLVILCLVSAAPAVFAQSTVKGPAKIPGPVTIPAPSGGGANTWTNAQSPVVNNSCSNTAATCALTVTSTGSGHVGVILFSVGNNGTNILNSVTGGGGTWVIPVGCQAHDSTAGVGVGCAYNLSLASGVTSITCNWQTTNPGAGTGCTFYEEIPSTGSATLDTTGSHDNTSTATTQPGPTLTLTGASDFCAQVTGVGVGAPTAISGSYVFDGGANFNAVAHILNTASGAAITWTNSGTSTSAVGAICLK